MYASESLGWRCTYLSFSRSSITCFTCLPVGVKNCSWETTSDTKSACFTPPCSSVPCDFNTRMRANSISTTRSEFWLLVLAGATLASVAYRTKRGERGERGRA